MPYYWHFEFYKSIVVQSQNGVKKIIKNIPKYMHSLHRLLINAALFGTKLTFLTKCHFILYLFKRIFFYNTQENLHKFSFFTTFYFNFNFAVFDDSTFDYNILSII